jgi:hypothetical protein
MSPRIAPPILALAIAAASLWGCNVLLDASAYHVAPAAGGAVDAGILAAKAGNEPSGAPDIDSSLDDPSGSCTPGTNRPSLENSCTGSDCVPFALALPSCDGGLCPLPVSFHASSSETTATVYDAAPVDGEDGRDPAESGGHDSSAATGGAATSGAATGGAATGGAATSSSRNGVDGGLNNPCTAVNPDPNDIIFVTGSTALASFINEVSQILATQPDNPITVVYQESGSCVGVAAAVDPTDTRMVPSLGATTYYDSTGTQRTCDLDPDGVVADIGASDVFYSTCYLGQEAAPALPQGVAENFGPIQVMNFAVPQASSEKSISLRAAYYVFGFGGTTYAIAPWVDPTQLEIRSATSGTQTMIAAAIGVPPALWNGVPHSTSALVGQALVSSGRSGDSSVVNSALGILASDYLIANSSTLRGLAVEDDNTRCGYYPNSTATSRDDANVRNGHYPLWGPSHFYARVDSQTQVPIKPGAAQFIDGLSGVKALPGLDLVGEYASSGLIPACAMGVSRSNDGGDYTPYRAPVTCNCYFDLMATGTTTCDPCSTNADCPSDSPNCNKFGPAPQKGYCDL